MVKVVEEDEVLPGFRSDIKLYVGPHADDGSPTYTVHDPIKGDYWKISWPESLVLQYHIPGMTVEALADKINSRTTCKVTQEEIVSFFKQAKMHNLLKEEKTGEQLYGEWEATRKSSLSFLTNLFIRIPLFKPDRFLAKTLPYVLFLVSKPALILYAVLSVMGIAMVFVNLERYFSTFSYFFNFEGLIAYITTIFIVKTIHEFSHAYTAARYGVNVPTMGLLFIVIWPMLYTDITNSWKLWSRKQRIAITSAGVASELIMAGITTFAWAVTEPGLLKSAFFLVSSATWITSLFINLNPAIKFDGYLLLSDIWGIDNLQMRGMAVTRWKIIHGLLGYDMENPEPALTSRTLNGMFIYGLFTWFYRFVVYSYIVYFIYTHVTKVLAVLISLIVIGNYLVYPLVQEYKHFKKQNLHLAHPIQYRLVNVLIIVILLGIVLPLPKTITVEAITAPVNSQNVYASTSSVIKQVYVENGQQVNQGDPLIQLYSPKLEYERLEAASKVRELEASKKMAGLNEEIQDFFRSKQEELEAARINLASIEEQIEKLRIVAAVSGQVSNWKRGLQNGLPVKKGEILFQVVDETTIKVVGFVPEKELDSLSLGQNAEFCLNSHRNCYTGEISQIQGTRQMLLDKPQMASIYGGKLLTTAEERTTREGKATLVESFYTIDVNLDAKGEEVGFGHRGFIEVSVGWRSLLFEWIKSLHGLVLRESGM